jgi:hypothetical protein
VLAWPAASTLAMRDRGLDAVAFGRTAEDFHAGHDRPHPSGRADRPRGATVEDDEVPNLPWTEPAAEINA